MNIPAQLIGIVAMVLLFITYQINDRRFILIFHICISICWTIHYGMLGATSGLIINIICFIRNIIFYYRGRNKWTDHILLPIIISISEIISTLFAWQSPVDMLALIGAPLQTVALWMKSPRSIRLLMVTASPLWLMYDFFNGSYVGIVTESIVILSIVAAIIKYDLPKKV